MTAFIWTSTVSFEKKLTEAKIIWHIAYQHGTKHKFDIYLFICLRIGTGVGFGADENELGRENEDNGGDCALGAGALAGALGGGESAYSKLPSST